MKKRVAAVVLAVVLAFTMSAALAGCRESDNSGVTRKLTVLNVRSDTVIMELTGTFSITSNTEDELVIICQTGENEYKKHYVYLNDWTVYTVEDISGANVDPYKYEINFYPYALSYVEWNLAVG